MNRNAWALIACGLLCACPSVTNLKTARALDKGEYELTLAVEAGGVSVPTTSTNAGGSVVYPQFEFAGRWGIGDGLDLGFKVYPVGAEFDATVQLVRGDFSLALDPGVGIFGIYLFNSNNTENVSFVSIPVHLDLLAGIGSAEGTQFVIGPGLYTFFTLSGASASGSSASESAITLMAGGSVGVSFAVSKTFRIMPEFDIYFPIAGAVTSSSSTQAGFQVDGSFIYAAALGFSFGNGPADSRPHGR
jgi:hypothetical protein